MYIVRILGDETTIDLGRRGENRALAIDFPIDNFIANYGAGMASLAHLRPGDTEPYICGTETVVSDGATYLRWVVTDTDTAKAGSGRCELRWNVDDTGDGDPIDDYDTRAKSIIYTTTVHPSLTDETKIPDPYKDWYDAMMAALAPAIDAADSPVLQLLNGGVKTTSSSTNLNSFKYVTEGVYYHDGSVTLTNAPVSGQFVMIVREQPMQQNPSDTEYTLSWFTRVIVTLGSAPQVWIQCGQLYRPFTHPPTFLTWRKIPSASDITSIESDLDTLTTAVTNAVQIISSAETSSATYASLDDIPLNTIGQARFAAAICPFGVETNLPYICMGTTARRMIIVGRISAAESVYINTGSSSGWYGWEQIDNVPKQLSGITSLSDVPLGSNGYAQFDASVSPTGATAYFTYWCTGTDDRRSIIAVYTADSTAKAYVNVLHNADKVTWKGWQAITMS